MIYRVVQKSYSFLSYVEEKLWGFKNPENVRFFLKKKSKFSFLFKKLTTGKIFDYKEIFFLFYVAKSISF